MGAQRQQRPPKLDRPGPRLLAGAVGGFVAGVVFIALTSWFVTSMGQPPLQPFTLIASIAAIAPPQIPTLWLGMAIHCALSVVFGMIFAGLTALVRGNGMLMAGGFIYGGIIYVIDFQILARFLEIFSNFRAVNQPFELAVHLVFGGVLALFLLRPRQRAGTSEQATREEIPEVPTGAR